MSFLPHTLLACAGNTFAPYGVANPVVCVPAPGPQLSCTGGTLRPRRPDDHSTTSWLTSRRTSGQPNSDSCARSARRVQTTCFFAPTPGSGYSGDGARGRHWVSILGGVGFDSKAKEARGLADWLRQLVKEGFQPNEIAIFGRTDALVNDIGGSAVKIAGMAAHKLVDDEPPSGEDVFIGIPCTGQKGSSSRRSP